MRIPKQLERLRRVRLSLPKELKADGVDPDAYRYIAIVTYGRTGSTVLQRVLNSIPGVLVRGENRNAFVGMYQTYRELRAAHERFGGGLGLVNRADSHPWYGIERIDPAGVLASFRHVAVGQILRPLPETTVLGFKEVRYTPWDFDSFDDMVDYVVFLDALFPGVRILINVRDPARTARSGWWVKRPDAAEGLTTALDWMRRLPAALEQRLGEPRAVLVEHEQWTKDPTVLRPAIAFLGLDIGDDRLAEIVAEPLTHMKG